LALADLFEHRHLVVDGKRSAMHQLAGIGSQPVANDLLFGLATIVVEVNAGSNPDVEKHLVETRFPAAPSRNWGTVDENRVDIARKRPGPIRAKEPERVTLPNERSQCHFDRCFAAELFQLPARLFAKLRLGFQRKNRRAWEIPAQSESRGAAPEFYDPPCVPLHQIVADCSICLLA
jgi:hypothetical protein